MAYTPMQTSKQEETTSQAGKKYILPALGLFFLSPLVGEFLLGNLSITWLWTLLVLAPLYGGGALLIRETARRLGWGWPSIVILGLVYAIVEEAFVTQSLFNPNYVGLRLLDYGYISSLGISAWWTTFVLGLHTVWSTSVPIALVENLTPQARRTPWLGAWGFAVTALIFVIGCALTFVTQQQDSPFMASTAQFTASAVVVVLLIIVAILLGRSKQDTHTDPQPPPSVPVVGGVLFVLGSAFMLLALVHDQTPVILSVGGMVGALIVGSFLLWRWSRRADWSARHEFAAAGGLLLVYAWYGFVQVPSAGDTSPLVDTVGNAVFSIAALILLLIGWRRLSAGTNASVETGESHAT